MTFPASLCPRVGTFVLHQLSRRPIRRSLATQAKKKKQREYGSGREQFGLPPLEVAAAEEEESVPTLRDYLEFGQLMGESPADVTRQLEMNNQAVVVDEESIDMLSDWEDEELQAYAVFEALMESELAGSAGSAASATLQRNKNRVAPELPEKTKPRGSAQPSAAQRKLAKNKGRSMSLASAALKGLGSMLSTPSGGLGGFEQLATKPVRPSPSADLQKPQRPGAATSKPAQAAVDGEDTSFLDDDALWAETAPTYDQFERALGGSAPARPSPTAASLQPPPARPGAPARSRPAVRLPQVPQKLLPRPTNAALTKRQQPPVLAAAPVRPGPPAKPTAPAAPAAKAKAASPPAPKPVPALSARLARPEPQKLAAKPAPKPEAPKAVKVEKPKAAAAPAPAAPAPAPPAPAARPVAAAKPAALPSPAEASQPVLSPRPKQPQRAAAPAAPAAAAVEQQSGAAAPKAHPAASQGKAEAEAEAGAGAEAEAEAGAEAGAGLKERAAAEAPQQPQPATPAVPAAPQQVQQQQQTLQQPEASLQLQRPSLKSLTEAAVAATAMAALAGKPAAAPQPAAPAAAAPQAPARPPGRLLQAPSRRGRANQQQQQQQQQVPRWQMLQRARECLGTGEAVEVTVWEVNGAGVLVKGGGLSGFVPMSKLSTQHGMRVLQEEERLVQQEQQEQQGQQGQQGGEAPAPGAPRTLRRQAMRVLLGESFSACVIMVKEEEGQVVMSERAAATRASGSPDAQSAEVAAAALPLLGQVVQATVRSVKPFGCFVEFEIPAATLTIPGPGGSTIGSSGSAEGQRQGSLRGMGLVHASQLSWERVEDPAAVVQVGQSLPAVVSHVDLDKGRVFLSFRNATPHPLQQTLETLLSVTSSGSAVAAAGAAGATGAAAAASGAAEPLADLRAALGDMAEAVRFCEALRGVEGVRDAQPGVRLQSRASSQALEVYLSRESGELPAEEGASSYRLVLRKGLSVQEVSVSASLARDELRQLAADLVAELAAASV